MQRRLFNYNFVFLLFVSTLSYSFYYPVSVAHAQAGQAELTGEVRDQEGAAVEQAQLTATEVSTGQSFTSTTGESGVYTITNLKPGAYSITVEATGFKRLVREGVQLATGERVRVDVTLETGTVNESVTVNANASLLRTETGSLGQVISNRKIVGRTSPSPTASTGGWTAMFQAVTSRTSSSPALRMNCPSAAERCSTPEGLQESSCRGGKWRAW